MANIIYRNYQRGDDAQLAHLYMKAFQENRASYIRTAKIQHWRYAQSPNFEPEMVQIAEDTEKGQIIGAVYVNLVERIRINNKSLVVGDINDVSCHPDYTQQGIATNLMENAIEYMEQKGCDLSILTADYSGIARKKIYLRFGFKDAARLNAYINFPHYFRLLRDFPPLITLTPLLFYSAYLSRLSFYTKCYKNSFFGDFSYHLIDNSHHMEFAKLMNRLLPKYYRGYSNYSNEKVEWARKRVPNPRGEPTYVLIRNQQNILGGASLTFEKFFLTPLQTTIRLGIIHELAINREFFPDRELLRKGIAYLIDKVMKAAIQRNIGVLLYEGDANDKAVEKAFRLLKFRVFKGGVLMVKQFRDLDIQQEGKPWFVPTYVSTGFP
jgi:predicted N-acetyltransferase YhbS